MRLFFGVELPEPLRERLARVQSLLRQADAHVRWVEPSNAHFTVKFLGSVRADEIPRLDYAAAPVTAAARPIALRVEGLGTFPPPVRRARVVWMGITGETALLGTLHDRLDEALAAAGFPRDGRRFHPHVTVGRIRGTRGLGALAATIGGLEHERLGALTMRELTLLCSHPSSAGPHYERVAGYPLGG